MPPTEKASGHPLISLSIIFDNSITVELFEIYSGNFIDNVYPMETI